MPEGPIYRVWVAIFHAADAELYAGREEFSANWVNPDQTSTSNHKVLELPRTTEPCVVATESVSASRCFQDHHTHA